MTLPAPAPEDFAAGLAQLQRVLDGPVRRGLSLRAVPAPRKMAPWSFAVAAEVSRDGDDVASGRFIVLHDPDGQDGWHGCTRIVAFVEAQVEAEMAADPALADVGWSWLVEALDERGVAHTAAGGTVTRTVSKRFGALEGGDDASEVEVRASWTALAATQGLERGDLEPADLEPGSHAPAGPELGALDLGSHLLAWCDLLCSTAGLPPDGVVALHPRQA